MTEYFKSFKNQQQKLEQFSNTKSVDERLRLVYQALSNSKDFSEVKELFKNKVPRNNSTDQSKQKRDIGNKFYQKKQFKEAVKAYTDSALAVTIDVNGKSREISLALGNRSAVFYQLGERIHTAASDLLDLRDNWWRGSARCRQSWPHTLRQCADITHYTQHARHTCTPLLH